MTNLESKRQVRVLNIHPNSGGSITFTTWNGETLTIPKSASLKQWMEEPNEEHEKGYGQGLIEVTPVSITLFNENPEDYLYKENGEWIYDVIMFGSWDSNGDKDISSKALEVTKSFIEEDKGILIGHDVLRLKYAPNFTELRKYINIELAGDENIPDSYDHMTYNIVSRTIKKNKTGLLTEYPWYVDKTELNIPLTHSRRQWAKGDVWFNFINLDDNALSGSGNIIYEGINGELTNNFYLTTYNNGAMIQTGHSNGESTPDEQKVIANTLFYLNQLTTENFLNDHSSQDINAPENPVILSSIIDLENNKFIFNLEDIEDIGTKYSYYIEAIGQNDGEVKTSNIAETEIKSGFKGYSYVIDTNTDTEPDNNIDTTDNIIEFNFNKPTSNKYYLHIKSIDNIGNFSETVHYEIGDTESPELNLTVSNTDITNDEVSVIVNCEDNTKIDYILLPNNQKVYSNNITYSILEDGEYRFVVYDIFGNFTEKTIIISNIDKEKPSIIIDKNDNWTNKGVQININTRD